MKIDYYQIIQAVIIVLPLLLIVFNSWLKSDIGQFAQELTTSRKVKERIGTWLILYLATVVLMLLIAKSFLLVFNNFYFWIAIVVNLFLTFFMIQSLQNFLEEIRGNKQIMNFVMNNNFIIILLTIISIQLLVLFWLKELEFYTEKLFLNFVFGYSLLIAISGIFLGFPKQNWQYKWRLFIITIIDTMIIVSCEIILVKIILSIIKWLPIT